jgi:sulfite exporter TauE/SafE
MIELPLIFVAGLFGSAHCIGMCGPIALALSGGARNWRANLAKQIVYTLGRVATYTSLGAIAAFGGWRLATSFPHFAAIPAALSIAAGGVLLHQGLMALGLIRRRSVNASRCLAAGLFAPLFHSQRLGASFLAGVTTAFLPCGLIYGMLALSAASLDMGRGAAIMAVFAVGTAPIMIMLGTSATLLVGLNRARLNFFANCCVLIAGALCIARGVIALRSEGFASPIHEAAINESKVPSTVTGPWCR